MSGNPFRASLVPKHPTAAPPASFISVDANRGTETRDERDRDAVLDAPSAQPARTKKSVRIESPTEIIPPHSAFHDKDDPLLHVNRSHHAGSPQLMSPAGFSDNFEDIDIDDIQRAEDLHAAGMTAGTRKSTGAPEAVPSLSGAPANPFSRTLASIEPQEKASGEPAAQNRDRTGTEKTATGTTKPSLDVEGFKNLLMTGISSPRSSGPPPQAAPAANPISTSVFESSSSTDTSSISRQSIFDPAVQEPHPESPRTSYEMAASDDERIGLVRENKKQKKKPPPTPKHRHGKLVNSRTPQTVSFEGFSATEPTSSPPISRHKRTDSDLNKPLPPTPPIVSPPAHIISQDITQDSLSISDAKLSDTASLSDASSAQKRVPPPVPITRRQSQLRSSIAGNRSRSNSSLTISSQHSIELPLLSPGSNQEPSTSSPSPKAPPPPPPSRRHGAALATISTSSANSSTTELANAANTARRPTVSSPNPPAARRTTISSDPPSPSPGVQRTSSLNSNRNANPNRSVSNESTASMPPPPPPPRRRQSGRASLDKERPNMHHQPSSPTESRRTSTEHKRNSIESKRRTSVASESSLKYEYAPTAESEHVLYSPREEKEDNIEEEGTEQANASSILDDMEKFQKEIDELRAKYKEAA